jgi:hypothetical protein
VTGSASDDDHAEAIIVEYWKDDGVGDPVADPDSVDWIMAGRYAPTATQIDITSIVGGGTYYTAISYVVGGVAGDRLVQGPVTAGSVDVSGQVSPANRQCRGAAAVEAGRARQDIGGVAVEHLFERRRRGGCHSDRQQQRRAGGASMA